jgi:hypothetical protein
MGHAQHPKGGASIEGVKRGPLPERQTGPLGEAVPTSRLELVQH